MAGSQDVFRIFKTKVFARLCAKEMIDDSDLVRCIAEIEAGRTDAALGRGLYKQRLPREGGGKSGGYRTILVFRRGQRAVFLDVFAKSRKANISVKETRAYQCLAATFLGFTDEELGKIVKSGELIEIGRKGNQYANKAKETQ